MTEFYPDGQRLVAHVCGASVLFFIRMIILKMRVSLDRIMSRQQHKYFQLLPSAS